MMKTLDATYKKLMKACTAYMIGKDVDMGEIRDMVKVIGDARNSGYQVPEFELPYRIATGSIKRGCFHV